MHLVLHFWLKNENYYEFVETLIISFDKMAIVGVTKHKILTISEHTKDDTISKQLFTIKRSLIRSSGKISFAVMIFEDWV